MSYSDIVSLAVELERTASRVEAREERVTQKRKRAASCKDAQLAARLRDAALDAFEKRMLERWGVNIKAARLPTPTLTGGDLEKARALSEKHSVFVVQKGKLVEQIIRRGKNGQKAFIDQLTFVMDKASFSKLIDRPELDDRQIVETASVWLKTIFGFAVSHDREKGANFYSSSYNIGDHENTYGIVCIGGGLNASNETTVCFEFTATGIAAANDGWEQRLYEFSNLPEVSGFRYTRVDLAHDFMSGEYSVDDALKAYKSGGFTNAITVPALRLEGSDWFNDTKKGRTLYVGTRQSSRMLRFYEKGKQLGDAESPWVRCELELRSRDLIIPLDIVLHAGDYLANQYPELIRLFEQTENSDRRIKVKQRTLQAGIEHSIKYLRMQGSRAVNALLHLGIDWEDIRKVFDEKAGVPKRVHPGQYFAQLLDIDLIHDKFLNPVCGYDG